MSVAAPTEDRATRAVERPGPAHEGSVLGVLGVLGVREVLVGFDGSPAAVAAIDVAGHLLPGRHARVAHLWSTPDGGSPLHRRLASRALHTEHLEALVAREAAASGIDVARGGTTLARAAGWTAEPVLRRVYSGEAFALVELAEEFRPAVVVVGSRGRGGLRGLFGSVSALTVSHSSVPVLVVPPMLAAERAAAAGGPVLIAHDGSADADRARRVATELFTGRPQVAAHVVPGFGRPLGLPFGTGASVAAGVPDDAVTLRAEGFGPRAVADTLADEAADRGAGVIVVGSHDRPALRELVAGSVTRTLLRHGHRPVLIVPPAAAQPKGEPSVASA